MALKIANCQKTIGRSPTSNLLKAIHYVEVEAPNNNLSPVIRRSMAKASIDVKPAFCAIARLFLMAALASCC